MALDHLNRPGYRHRRPRGTDHPWQPDIHGDTSDLVRLGSARINIMTVH
jgi:hypothetical protein